MPVSAAAKPDRAANCGPPAGSRVARQLLLELLQERLPLREPGDVLGRGELAQELFLPVRQPFRNLDQDLDELVAGPLGPQVGQPLPLELEDLPVLRARRELELLPAIQRRYLDACAEGRLRERDRDLADEVVVVP